MYDIIGDIHGHADKLEALLQSMGYHCHNGHYAHPSRKALFVGDYIDRGPKIRETLQIVRGMVENDAAIALMGNHEYNALCFHYKGTEGKSLREHSEKNIAQHNETLKQFHGNEKDYISYLEWFKTLPLFFEGNGIRAVHATWDASHIDLLKGTLQDNCLTDELIYESVKKGTEFHRAIEDTLKGKELSLPENVPPFKDKDGAFRHEFRVKWWEDFSNSTYRDLSIEYIEGLPASPVEKNGQGWHYPHDELPVFFGHYWLKGVPGLFRGNICCVDYSVAKNGYLTAYRYDGEDTLDNEGFVCV